MLAHRFLLIIGHPADSTNCSLKASLLVLDPVYIFLYVVVEYKLAIELSADKHLVIRGLAWTQGMKHFQKSNGACTQKHVQGSVPTSLPQFRISKSISACSQSLQGPNTNAIFSKNTQAPAGAVYPGVDQYRLLQSARKKIVLTSHPFHLRVTNLQLTIDSLVQGSRPSTLHES